MKKASLHFADQQLTDRLAVCCNFYERARGLLWRQPLQAVAGEALLIPKCRSVHTLFMGYAIDVIFLDANGKITSITRGLKPWRAASDAKARQIVECPEGCVWTQNLSTGQVLSIQIVD